MSVTMIIFAPSVIIFLWIRPEAWKSTPIQCQVQTRSMDTKCCNKTIPAHQSCGCVEIGAKQIYGGFQKEIHESPGILSDLSPTKDITSTN